MIKQRNKTVFSEMQSAKGYVRRQRWTAPLLGTTTKIHAAISTVGTVTTGITQPDFPRVLSITEGGATHTATGNVVITGTDIRGNQISDTIALPGSATTVNGVKAFATVSSVTTATGIDASNTVSIGTAAPLGLDRVMDADEYVNGSASGTFEATRATITYDPTDISKNTVSFNTALNGTLVMRAVYVTKELTTYTQTTS